MKFSKNKIVYALAFAMVLFTVSGCSKDSETNDNPAGGGGGSNTNQTVFLDANVNGAVFAKGAVPGVGFDSSLNMVTMIYNSPGSGDTTLSISFNISGANSLTVGGNFTPAFIIKSKGINGFHVPMSGFMNITSNDKTKKTVGGTFEFSSKSNDNKTVSVTGGKFWVKY